jgi:hypothetical protein
MLLLTFHRQPRARPRVKPAGHIHDALQWTASVVPRSNSESEVRSRSSECSSAPGMLAAAPLRRAPHVHNPNIPVAPRRQFLDRDLVRPLQRQAVAHPTHDPVLNEARHPLHAHASQAVARFLRRFSILRHQDQLAIQTDQRSGPGRELSAQPDVDRPWGVAGAELICRARIEDRHAVLAHPFRLSRRNGHHRRHGGERCGALAVDGDVALEVSGRAGKSSVIRVMNSSRPSAAARS